MAVVQSWPFSGGRGITRQIFVGRTCLLCYTCKLIFTVSHFNMYLQKNLNNIFESKCYHDKMSKARTISGSNSMLIIIMIIIIMMMSTFSLCWYIVQCSTNFTVIFLDFHSTKQGLPLVDSWSHGLD